MSNELAVAVQQRAAELARAKITHIRAIEACQASIRAKNAAEAAKSQAGTNEARAQSALTEAVRAYVAAHPETGDMPL